MRFRSSAALTTSVIALSTLAFYPIDRPVLAQNAAPQGNAALATTTNEATITAVRGREVTLGIGSDDGAQVGGVYGVAREGKIRARVRITAVRRTESTGTIFEKDEEFVVAVGDTGQFIAVQPVPNEPVTPVTPTVPTTPVTPPTTPVTPNNPVSPTLPTTPNTGTSTTTPQTATTTPGTPGAVGANTLSTVTISAVEGTTIRLGGGTGQGVRPGSTVPVLRDGNVIALVRIQSATTDTSTGVVVYRDETAPSLTVGDTIGLIPGAGTTGLPTTGPVETIPSTPTVTPNIPAARIRYETGASNAVVPRSSLTYQYLAALATAKLITRHPPHIFYDEGARFHRTEEDINFTRAQIADLIWEALNSPKAEEPSQRTRTALAALTMQYATELRQLGVAEDALTRFGENKGLSFGYSGHSRASLVGGTDTGVIDPFSERYGGRRSRSGIDGQTNIFAQAGNDLSLFAMFNTGTDTRRGGVNNPDFQIRRALARYRADRLLRGLTIEAGRNEVWWGPGHFGTLLLSDVAGPLNHLMTTFSRGSYKFQSLYAALDSGPLGGSRSLYGHNLQIQVGPQSRIGIAETLLIPNSRLDAVSFASAFSPLPLFTAERLRKRNTAANQGNALVQAYFETSLARGLQGYGEFLADDIGVNQNNLVRNRLGTLVGAHLFTPGDPTRLGLYAEYSNLQGRTYLGLRALNNTDYYYRGRPLGYPVAPIPGAGLGGAESLRFETYWRAARRLRLGLGVELADLQSEQPTTVGARARQQIYRFRAAYDLAQNLTLIGRAQRVATSQPNFQVGEGSISQRLFQIEIARSF